jgi:RNA polymerase sigma-70 factor (sigma-E family)
VRTRLEPSVADEELRRAYQEHRLALVRLCVLLVGDVATAEDIVQDVFVRARRRLAELGGAGVYAYLRRSTINGWKNHLRHRAAEERAIGKMSAPSPAHPSAEVDERDTMWAEIAGLPSRQRAVLVLRYYEELSDTEIAQLLGCRTGTVRSQAKRALDKLRETVER